MLSSNRLATLWLLLSAVATSSQAKTWIDCIDHRYHIVYSATDNGKCEGYAYNYPGSDGGDYSYKLDASQLKSDAVSVCQYNQADAVYKDWRHVVHAKPGDELYLGYLPNGHIIKDGTGAGSKWGVYWSGHAGVELTKPSELTTEKLVDGELKPFDDGNCGLRYVDEKGNTFLERTGGEKPCVGSFSIPEGTKPGRYQMIWYWKSVAPSSGYSSEPEELAYTSCFDVIVEEGAGVSEHRDSVSAVPESVLSKKHRRCDAGDDEEPDTVADAVQGALETVVPAAVQVQPVSSFAEPPKSTPSPAATTDSPSVTPLPLNTPAQSTEAPVPSAAPPTQSSAPTPSTIPSPTDFSVDPAESPLVAALDAPADAIVASPSSTFTAPLATVTYNGVGGSGIYGKVTAMQCPSDNSCSQTDFAVSGPLAPFDEDLTVALRGPMNVDDIAVFTSPASGSGAMWSRVSAYSKESGTSENMVFLNNKGDPLKSGTFDMCNGNSQSYATADGSTAATAATQFGGTLGDNVEVNIMSATSCQQSGTCGVSRGVAQEGWKGNSKIFMIKAQMPNAPVGGKNTPAIWLLNSQVVRTAEYACNCRGMGDQGKWKGGCGELDVAEILPADVNGLTSTIYSFKGSRGTNTYALRPVDDAVVFVVILTEQTTTGSKNLGMAQILMMKPENIDMSTPPTPQQVDEWLKYRNGAQVNFDI